MSNINIEINEARAKLFALQDNNRIYNGLQRLFDGNITPGDTNTIEFVAFAVRGNYSIPLKYTQSYASLRSLYEYAIEKSDTMLCQWTENQIIQVLGPNVMVSIRNDLQIKKKIPTATRSNRQLFLEKYHDMSLKDLLTFSFKEDSTSFWGKQIQRVHHANVLLEKMRPSPIPQIKPFSELLKVSFFNEQSIKFGTECHPDKLIKDAKVAPYVFIPCLIEAHATTRNLQAIFFSPYLKNGLVFKKYALPNEIIEKILKKNNFNENDYKPLMEK